MGHIDEEERSWRHRRPAPEPDPLLPAGSTLGSWRVVKLLGEGGMGRVYLAEHASIGRKVALKVLKRQLARSPELVERFFAEAHAVNRIRHPGIVEVTDCFVDDDVPCIVMELLEGRTLSEEMMAMRIHPARVAAIGADVADALDAAHKAGVIHRDLKPDNLFLVVHDDGTETVKVLDFGVAKLMDPMPNSTVQTVAGSIMGTPDYMAPEQLAGKPVDARADVYALGASLYHACTGRPPFTATNFGDLVVMHMTKPPTPPTRFANLPAAIEQVLLAMLEKDPARRPQSMADVAKLLRIAEKHPGVLEPALLSAATAPRASLYGAPLSPGPALPRGGTAPFVSAQGPGTASFSALDVRPPVGPPPEALVALPLVPALRDRALADARPMTLHDVVEDAPATPSFVAPLHKHTPSGTLLLGSAQATAPGTTRAPLLLDQPKAAMAMTVFKPSPAWAWAVVTMLLFVALGGGTWAVKQPNAAVRDLASVDTTGSGAPAAPAGELELATTAPVDVAVPVDTAAPAVEKRAQPAKVTKAKPRAKTKSAKAKVTKGAKVTTTVDKRRAVLDPFAERQ